MEEAIRYMGSHVLDMGLEFDELDINKTGLIGPEFSELTTTPGDIEAKRSSLNPYMASVMLRYFHECGLEKNDKIAIGSSGSFPGLLIATLIASSKMELDVNLMLSVGSSMHGATRVEYNIFDIARDLRENDFADFNLLAVSCGGKNDQGGSVLEDILYEDTDILALNLAQEAAEYFGATLITEEDFEENVAKRVELYGEDVKLFVNVGGASVNTGDNGASSLCPPGLVTQMPDVDEENLNGLMFYYLSQGIPVINLLNVKKICYDNGLIFDPFPLFPAQYEGRNLERPEFSSSLIILTLIGAVIPLVWGIIRARRRD